MIIKSMHRRMASMSLPLLCGMVILTVVTCIIAVVYKIVNTFKSG